MSDTHSKCFNCGRSGYIGSACGTCGHEIGATSTADCPCPDCTGRCHECKGTGTRQGWFGSGFCVACDGTGKS